MVHICAFNVVRCPHPNYSTHLQSMCGVPPPLGSIMDFQVSWKSGRFQLARGNHKVALFPATTGNPPVHPTSCNGGPPTHLPDVNPESHLYPDYIFTQLDIATLGSILDSQLSWEYGKFQLARWSHEVVLYSVRTRPTDPTTQSSLRTRFFFQCCAVYYQKSF